MSNELTLRSRIIFNDHSVHAPRWDGRRMCNGFVEHGMWKNRYDIRQYISDTFVEPRTGEPYDGGRWELSPENLEQIIARLKAGPLPPHAESWNDEDDPEAERQEDLRVFEDAQKYLTNCPNNLAKIAHQNGVPRPNYNNDPAELWRIVYFECEW